MPTRNLMAASALSLSACATTISGVAQPDITALCANTVNEYAHARDIGDIDRAKTLFTEDATTTIFGNTQNGRKAILEAMKTCADGAVSRHMIGSVLITPTGANTAKGESYVLVIIGEDDGTRPLSLSDDNLFAAGTYEDTFRLENGRCKIATRNVVVDFQKK